MLPMIRKNLVFPAFADEFFGKDFLNDLADFKTGISVPAVNISESKEDFKIEIAAPGLSKEDFKIDLNNNILTISSEKKDEKNENTPKYMRREFCYTSFSRSFSLPQLVNSEQISATHANGILMISIPKKEEAKERPVRRIEIA